MIWYYTLAASRRTNGYRLAIWGVVIRLSQAVQFFKIVSFTVQITDSFLDRAA